MPSDGQLPTGAHQRVPEGRREETYLNPNSSGEYERHWRAGAQLVRVSTSPIRYERRLRDGGVEEYTLDFRRRRIEI